MWSKNSCICLDCKANDKNQYFGRGIVVNVVSEECIWSKVGHERLNLKTEVADMSESQRYSYFIKYGRKQGTKRTKLLDKGRKMSQSLCAEACSVQATDETDDL